MADKEKRTIIKYNQELLDLSLKRDEASLKTEQTNLTRESVISFICKCGVAKSKTLRLLYNVGAYCDDCRKIKTSEKRKATNIEKFGVEHPFQNKEIKDKIKKTFVDKYGVDNPSKNKDIRDKQKQSCLERFGSESPLV
jgi:hypothetical protein